MTAISTVALSVQIGLRFVGIWPNASYALFFRGIWILTTSIVQISQYWWIVIHSGTDDMSHLMDGLSVTMEYSVMFLKLIILWLNSRIFYDILAEMAADWRRAAISEMHTMRNKANMSRYFSNVIIGLHSAAAFSYGIGVLVSQNDNYDIDEVETPPAREFTLKLQLPFESDESPRYELVMCLEFLHQLASSATTGVLNSLIITLILHASGQIEILCDALRDISSERNNQRFVSISRQGSDTIDSSSLMKAIVFYMAATVEAFIFCFCGEYLSAKSKMISDAAYETIWYDFEPNECKLILFIILRSQRRLTITAGKIMDLSLEGFTNVYYVQLKIIVETLYRSCCLSVSIMMRQCSMTASTVALSVQIGLRCIGFWPNTPCALLFRCLWILTIGIVQTFQYWWIIIHFRTDDMSYLMDSLSVTIEYSVMSLKLIILWFNSRIFYDVLAAMAADWREATNSETQIMISKANLSRRFSNVIIGLHSVAVFCFGIEVLASQTDDYDADHGTDTPVRAFTLKLQLPSQCNESPLYELVMGLEFFHQLASATATGILNSLLISLSKMIGDAAYKSIWYDFTPKESKLVLLIILRSQRRLTITAGKIMDLSLEGFTSMSRSDSMTTSTVAPSVQIGLRSIGFWPNTPCALLFRCLWILTIGIVQTFQYWWVIIHFKTDEMSYLMDGLSVTIGYSVMYLKLIILWFNSRIFYDVLAAMAADWREATNGETHIMMSKANLSRRFSNVIIGLNSVAVFCYGIEVLASQIDNYGTVHGTDTPVRAFTLKLQLPSQCNESPLYELVMGLEFFHHLASSIATGIFNCLLITLSKMIGDAAYKSIWHDFTPKESKLFLLVILRSQRRLTITAGKIMDLSLERFTSTFQYWWIIIHFRKDDMSYLMDGLSVTIEYSVISLKLIILWFYSRKLYAILDTMDKDWSNGIAIHSDVSTMVRHANWSRQCSNVMITTNAISVFFYVIGGLILRSIVQNKDDSTRELPIKMEFPFKVDNSPIFELILIFQFFHDLSVACIIAMLNALLVTLVLHVSGQIDIMLQGFMEISSKYTSRSSLATIKDLVNKHQRIIDLSDNIEDLFSNIALLQFIWNTLVICCIGFVIVISIGTEKGTTMITKSLIFYIAITLEAFVFCYAGEYLSAKSKSISDAAYECLWYDLTPSECRILMFLMLRSQKRLTITAGKITDLSLEGFTTCFLFGQFLYELVLASIVGMMNALLVSLILHVSGQIDIMQQDINEISNSKYNPSLSLMVIKGLICKHQKIITLSENIENLYTYIALMQLLWNTLVICCTGFVIVITIGTNTSATTSIKSVSFYIAITLEIFILCFAGEFLSAKSRLISDAVYEILWYNMPPTNSRILMFMILRSQKRLTITAGKVVDLTLEGFTNVMQYYQYMYIFVHFDSNDLWLLMDCLSLTLAYSLAFLKLLVLWWNRRIFYYIVKAIDEDWSECVINDSYKSTMVSMADLSRRFANVSFSIYAFSAFFLSIGEHLLQSMDNQFSNNSRELPIKMEFPFDVSKSPIFECFLIGQFLYDLLIASVVNLINALLVALILHVSGQIDIMQKDLVEISNKKYDRNTFISVIKSLICKHQKIITLSENIENLYTYIALMQVLWNTLVMCCTGFVIIISKSISNAVYEALWYNMPPSDSRVILFMMLRCQKRLTITAGRFMDLTLEGFTSALSSNKGIMVLIKSVFLYTAKTLEVFVFCYAGEFLSSKSKSIGDAIYESLWYNMVPSDSRILLLIMVRSQKRLTITAGKIFDLTLEGFMSSKAIGDAAYETVWYDLSISECRILLFVILRSQKRLTITAGKVVDLTLEGFTNVMKASASYISVLYAMY
ncbi:Putative odorant receptor 13a [Cyphomyrmex costatus]|uniref:Putative odorant receptor 13a n=1 Tax=Cyphomyrmex costatus TaxID=456900 RepID=A0A195C861_9HYME|nr:Putative odorant receptor 13a [Cyphomyrmex costatus]